MGAILERVPAEAFTGSQAGRLVDLETILPEVVRLSMQILESMKAELGACNGGKGIDLVSWVGCQGSFALAVGYSEIFWPRFVLHDGYILREGFSEKALAGFEEQNNGNRQAVETVMNHLHIADIQHLGCKDLTKDKIIVLGNILKDIYEAKLKYQFPDKPCTVSFYVPENAEDLMAYEISVWQEKYELKESA